MTTHRIPTSNGTACGICTAPATHMVTDEGWNGPACHLHAEHAERAGAEVAPLAGCICSGRTYPDACCLAGAHVFA